MENHEAADSFFRVCRGACSPLWIEKDDVVLLRRLCFYYLHFRFSYKFEAFKSADVAEMQLCCIRCKLDRFFHSDFLR